MNKKTIIPILLTLVAVAGHGQEIKKVAVTPEDFRITGRFFDPLKMADVIIMNGIKTL